MIEKRCSSESQTMGWYPSACWVCLILITPILRTISSPDRSMTRWRTPSAR